MKLGNVLLLLTVFATSACVPVRYSFNGQLYPTGSAMLAAQRRHQDEILSRVEPRSRALAAACRVVVPNHETVKKNAVLTSGEVPRATLELLTESLYSGNIFLTEAVRKRHTCDALQLEIGNGKRVLPRGDELLIYLHMPEVATAEWYVQRSPHERLLVPFDNRILDDDRRIRDWLLRLEAKVVLLSAPT